MDHIQFLFDIPYSETNSEIYRSIYRVEQWLRRIAYISMRICHGENWIDKIPSDIHRDLRARVGNLRGRILLDCENNSNLLWLSTFDELRKLMIIDPHWSFIKELTGYTNQEEFTDKINLLREIRNIVGHNRATTFETLDICKAKIRYFDKGIIRFKKKVVYQESNSDFKTAFFEPVSLGHQVLCNETQHFSMFVVGIFIDDEDTSYNPCINIAEVLESFKEFDNAILAITVDIDGNGYGLVCPKNLSPEDVGKITQKIIELEPHLWSEKDYLSQDAKYLCDPKIWFVTENPGADGDNFGTTKKNKIDDKDGNTSNVDNSDMMKQKDIDDKNNIIRFPKK